MTDSNAETQPSNPTTQQENPAMDKRTTLIEYFSDNETPTGDNFRELIESVVVQGDDGLNINTGYLELDNDLSVAGKITVGTTTLLNNEKLTLDDGQATLSADSLKVGDALNLSETTGLNINAPMNVEQDTLLKGSVAINATALDPQAALLVNGKSNIQGELEVESNALLHGNINVEGKANVRGDLEVDKELTVGSDEHSGQLTVLHKGDNSSVQIKHTNEQDQTSRLLCLDDIGRLSLGLDEGQAQAQLHIYHGASNS
jgi:predicted acyltransferase (DUF342 family)